MTKATEKNDFVIVQFVAEKEQFNKRINQEFLHYEQKKVLNSCNLLQFIATKTN